MADIIRKTVKPAHDGGCIPDPAHPGLDIAADGTSVVWDHHWITMHARGEIVVMTDEEIATIARAKEEAAQKAKADAEKAKAEAAKPVAEPSKPIVPATAPKSAPAAPTTTGA